MEEGQRSTSIKISKALCKMVLNEQVDGSFQGQEGSFRGYNLIYYLLSTCLELNYSTLLYGFPSTLEKYTVLKTSMILTKMLVALLKCLVKYQEVLKINLGIILKFLSSYEFYHSSWYNCTHVEQS
jgi:hypothetical protein